MLVNQIAFLNKYTMDCDVRAYVRSAFGPQDLPFNISYGNGAAIAEETVRKINEPYDTHTMRVPLCAGDLLMADNNRMAHVPGGLPASRDVLVAMARPIRLSAVAR